MQNFFNITLPGHLTVKADKLMVLDQFPFLRHRNLEVLFTGIPVDCYVIPDRQSVIPFHSRTADTASCADRHFNKAFFQSAFLNIIQSSNAVIDSVYSEVSVILRIAEHRTENSS